ncbi:9945_t:CDS:1, partial [Rhizophagus irregularis]
MSKLIDNCDELFYDNNLISNSKSKIYNKNTYTVNKKLLGLYITPDGISSTKKSRYIYGNINSFKNLVSTNEKEKILCEGYDIIHNQFSVSSQNVLIHKYFDKLLNGPVVIIKNDKSDIDVDIHKNLSKLSKTQNRKIFRCDSCDDIVIRSNEIKFSQK